MDRKRRLARLEEREAAGSRPTPAERGRPSDHEEARALDEGWGAYYELYSRYGWSRKEVDRDLEWAEELARRCDRSGLEDWQIVADMCAFVDSLKLPLDEVSGAFDDYPGPGRWRPSDRDPGRSRVKRLPGGGGC